MKDNRIHPVSNNEYIVEKDFRSIERLFTEKDALIERMYINGFEYLKSEVYMGDRKWILKLRVKCIS